MDGDRFNGLFLALEASVFLRFRPIAAFQEEQCRPQQHETDKTVDLASFGPVGWSETEPSFFRLATVFGLIPCHLARILRLS